MTKLIAMGSGGMQPSTPTIGTATDGGTGSTVSVAFTPSTYIGKGTITYTATSSPGGFTGTGSSSPITVSGLTAGTAYTFTVTGTTNYGVSSNSSAASNSVTPAVPGNFQTIATATISGTTSYTLSGIPSTYVWLYVSVAFTPSIDGAVLNQTFNNWTGAGDYSGLAVAEVGQNYTNYNITPSNDKFQITAGGRTGWQVGTIYMLTNYTVASTATNQSKVMTIPFWTDPYQLEFRTGGVALTAKNAALSSITLAASQNMNTPTRISIYGVSD